MKQAVAIFHRFSSDKMIETKAQQACVLLIPGPRRRGVAYDGWHVQ